MILLIDNYDSFTYNLYQFIGIFNNDIKVVRNDKITIEEIEKLDPESIVISPGPKSPKEAGISVEAIKHFAGKKPILGICLGHQSIGEAFGATVSYAKKLMHGKQSDVIHTGESIFAGIPSPVKVARYLFDATPSPRYGSRLASASGNARNVSMSIQDSIGEPPNEMFNRPTGTPSHWRILRPKKYASAEKSSSVSASQPCQNARS